MFSVGKVKEKSHAGSRMIRPIGNSRRTIEMFSYFFFFSSPRILSIFFPIGLQDFSAHVFRITTAAIWLKFLNGQNEVRISLTVDHSQRRSHVTPLPHYISTFFHPLPSKFAPESFRKTFAFAWYNNNSRNIRLFSAMDRRVSNCTTQSD